MKKINDVGYYDGGTIMAHHLYLSGGYTFTLLGRYDFTVFGTAIIGESGYITNNTLSIDIKKPIEMYLGDDSAVLFQRVPLPPRATPEAKEVSDIPDVMSEQEAQMHAMFEHWLALRMGGRIPAEGVDHYQDDEQGDEEEIEYDLDIPIDPPTVDPFLDVSGKEEPDENRDTVTEGDSATMPDDEGVSDSGSENALSSDPESERPLTAASDEAK